MTWAPDNEGYRRLGGFGFYQKRSWVAICLLVFAKAAFTLTTLFVLYVPQHRCFVFELGDLNSEFDLPQGSQNDSSNVNNSFAALTTFLPLENSTKDGSLQWGQCSRYLFDNGSNGTTVRSKGECNEGWSYLLDPGEVSAVSEFDLVCDKSWITPLGTSCLMLGFMAGSLGGGFLSDRFGRLKTVVISAVLMCAAGLGMAWTPVFVGVHVAFFFIGMAVIMRSTSSIVLVNELTPIKLRKQVGTLMIMAASMGNTSLPLYAYLIPNWRWMLTAMSLAIAAVLPLVFWLVDESLPWLIQRDRHEDAAKLVKKITQTNKISCDVKTEVTPDEGSEMEIPAEKERLTDGETASLKETTRQLTYIDLFRISFLRTRILILALAMLSVTLSYYGLSLNANRLGGNRYLNCLYSALVEIPCCCLCYVLLRKVTCRKMFVAATAMAGFCLILTPFLRAKSETAEVVCAMTGKFFSSVSFLIIYLFTGDFFPTLLRNQAYGAAAFFGRLSGILVPYLLYLGDVVHYSLPYLTMGCFSVAAAVGVFFLPETHGLELPHSIEEAKELENYRPKLSCKTKHQKVKRPDLNDNNKTTSSC